jgi:hypothetical protein
VPSYGDAIRLFRDAWQLAEVTLGERREQGERTKRLALRAAVGLSGAAIVYGDSGSDRDEQATRRGIQTRAASVSTRARSSRSEASRSRSARAS